MSVDQDIVDSTETLKADVKITHDIVHGSDTTEVMTNGGPVPSHAKLAKDSLDAMAKQLEPTVKTINEHAQLVVSKAGEATAGAEAVKQSKDEAIAALDDLAESSIALTSTALHAATVVMKSMHLPEVDA